MAGKSKFIQIHDPDLTLKGLKILVDKNCRKRSKSVDNL
jgi:hypothetical protein